MFGCSGFLRVMKLHLGVTFDFLIGHLKSHLRYQESAREFLLVLFQKRMFEVGILSSCSVSPTDVALLLGHRFSPKIVVKGPGALIQPLL